MKWIILKAICLALAVNCFGQSWTSQQLDSANTAKDIRFLTAAEKDAIFYINLARLYPAQFAKIEVENYTGTARYVDYVKNSSYKKSLLRDLRKRKSTHALQFDRELYDYAKCFSKELGDGGKVTHKRKICKTAKFAECCSYGMDTGKDIAMQWLIDDKVESLGHRINCLNPLYTKIGIGVHSHSVWTNCAVGDFLW